MVDGIWILIEASGPPGRIAWTYAALVQLLDPQTALLIVAPVPYPSAAEK